MDKTFCIFGDSVTQGSYVKTNWVEYLKQYLESKYKNDYISVFNLGINGNTTADIVKRFDNEAATRNPTSVIYAIGVNDSSYEKEITNTSVKEDNYRSNLNTLIAKAKRFTNDITFIGLVLGDDSILKPFPESSTGKCYDASVVKKYDVNISNIASTNGCRFISVLNKLDFNDFEDGLHPNDIGHKKMFEVIKNYF